MASIGGLLPPYAIVTTPNHHHLKKGRMIPTIPNDRFIVGLPTFSNSLLLVVFMLDPGP